MDFEPQKFFIGLIDFFSILLPGVLVTYLMKWEYLLATDEYATLVDTKGWIAFLFSSYLLGHFIFLLGSLLLDNHVYDTIREATDQGQISRLAKGKTLSPTLAKRLNALLIKRISDKAVGQVVRIKGRYLDPLKASSAINAFQWCKARLTLEHPEALTEIQRFEANSKFFRSLLIVSCVLSVLTCVDGNLIKGISGHPVIVPLGFSLLALLSFWR